MADTYEKDLAAKSSLTTSDYIRVVGSDNVSYKQGMSSVASVVKAVNDAIINGTDTNLNNYTETNVYHFDTTTSAMTNAPATGTYFSGFLFVNKYLSSKVLQTFYYSGSEKSVWVRMLWGGTWSAWVKEPTRAEVDALNSKTSFSIRSVSFAYNLAVGGNANTNLKNLIDADLPSGKSFLGIVGVGSGNLGIVIHNAYYSNSNYSLQLSNVGSVARSGNATIYYLCS